MGMFIVNFMHTRTWAWHALGCDGLSRVKGISSFAGGFASVFAEGFLFGSAAAEVVRHELQGADAAAECEELGA